MEGEHAPRETFLYDQILASVMESHARHSFESGGNPDACINHRQNAHWPVENSRFAAEYVSFFALFTRDEV
jgi:hypothetical protein